MKLVKEENMSRIIKLGGLGLVLSLLLAACNLPSGTPNAAATLQAVYTAQAQMAATLQVQPGATSTPGGLPTITFPTLPPFTAVPTLTPPAPPPPVVPVTHCDWAAYISDVSIPDGTIFAPGGQFTKTWRLQNIGTCAWTSAYTLVFSSGNSLGGGTMPVVSSGNVNPGQYVDVSVNLTAPALEGTYRGYWMLRNASGTLFGLGAAARDPFYVEIKVVGGMTKVFDFVDEYCKADWRSGAGDLGCPGNINGKKGYAIRVDNPQLENGQQYNGSGILTVPENVNNGFLQGYYQPFLVQRGDRFRAIINCQYLSTGCNAVFRLDYQLGDSQVQTIWQFAEAYEGQYYTIDTDLSALAGHQVKFVLTVLANGAAENDRPIWVAPRIDRPTNLVTPSATPSRTPTVTATATGLPPTATVTGTVTSTATVTATPTLTTTSLPSSTPTATATITSTATVTATPP
jgi:hypothetical protein